MVLWIQRREPHESWHPGKTRKFHRGNWLKKRISVWLHKGDLIVVCYYSVNFKHNCLSFAHNPWCRATVAFGKAFCRVCSAKSLSFLKIRTVVPSYKNSEVRLKFFQFFYQDRDTHCHRINRHDKNQLYNFKDFYFCCISFERVFVSRHASDDQRCFVVNLIVINISSLYLCGNGPI